jgi:hypothetical protein
MQRYYQSSPVLSGLGSLISGAVNTRHQVKAQEAAAQDRATMQVYGGMGQGLGNIASSYAGTVLDQHNRNVGHQNDMALLNQRGQQAQLLQDGVYNRSIDVENARSANDIYEQSLRAWDAVQYGGKNGSSSMGGMSMPGMDTGIGTNMDGSVMQPPAPPQGTLPAPAIDPGSTAMYRDAEQKRDELIQQGQRIQMSKLPPGEKAAALRQILPDLHQTTQMLRQYPRPDNGPKMPGPGGQMVPMQLGVNPFAAPLPNGGVLMDPDGKQHIIQPSKQAEADIEYTANRADGTVVKYKKGSSVEVRPGLWQMTDTNGNTSMFQEKEAGGDDKVEQARQKEEDRYAKAVDKARTALEKEAAMNVTENSPEPPPVTQAQIMERVRQDEAMVNSLMAASAPSKPVPPPKPANYRSLISGPPMSKDQIELGSIADQLRSQAARYGSMNDDEREQYNMLKQRYISLGGV